MSRQELGFFQRTSLLHPLSRMVVTGAGLFTLLFVLFMLSIISGYQLGNTLLRPSPFIPYEAIWPGLELDSLVAYARRTPEGFINCSSGVSATTSQPYPVTTTYVIPRDSAALNGRLVCFFQPASGAFRWVTVHVEDEQIQQVELLSDVLPEDALLLYWGMPDAISRMGSDQRLNLFWERNSYSAMATVVETTSTVRIVTLTAKEI